MNISKIKKCRFCNSDKLDSVLSLGKQHLQGYFKDNKRKHNKIFNKKFLTELVRCNPKKDKNACGLLQLSISVPSNILYKKYFYRSGVNSTMKIHLNGIANKIINAIIAIRPFKISAFLLNPKKKVGNSLSIIF